MHLHIWGISSSGRALHWQCKGKGFDSPILHFPFAGGGVAAESPAEKMLLKLLLHNKLITKSQIHRILEHTVGRSDKTLHEEILERHFVDPKVMNKVLHAINEKGLSFPLLIDQSL